LNNITTTHPKAEEEEEKEEEEDEREEKREGTENIEQHKLLIEYHQADSTAEPWHHIRAQCLLTP
jgi:hypothetical protein